MANIQNTQCFQIVGMDCANCARTVESGVARLDNVQAASLNFTTATLHVEGSVAPEKVIARVRDLGYDVVTETADGGPPFTAEPDRPPATGVHQSGLMSYLWRRWDTRLALFAALLIVPGLLFDELLPGLGIESPLFAAMSVLAMILAGYPIAQSALRAVRVNREITINMLMTIAAVGAVIIGAYTEAGLVMVLFALGEALEGYTADRARHAIRGLSDLAPTEATVLNGNSEERLPVGALSRRRPHRGPARRAPADGWTRAGRRVGRQPGTDHRREPAD
jgi:Zn2+/Cd2+-exporting ATPase